MALSTKQQITKRLTTGLDVEYLGGLNRLAQFAWGEKWKRYTPPTDTNEWPDFEDIQLKKVEIGASKKILNNQFISLSRVMYAAPRPEWVEIKDSWTNTIRQQFFLKRWHGDGGVDAEWSTHCERAYLDGDSLGVGYVQIGLMTVPKSGMQRVVVRHIPAWNVVYDRTVIDPVSARWICIKSILDAEDAVALYGAKAEEHIVPMYDNGTTLALDIVRVFEYYDLGIGSKSPTCATILGSIGNEPLKVTENVFGILPVAVYSHLCLAGFRRPLGRVAMQMGTQELVNNIESYQRKVLKDGAPVDIVDKNRLDDTELKKHVAGVQGVPIGLKGQGGTAGVWERIPAMEMPQTIRQMLNDAERELVASSGVTDADRGETTSTTRTAREITEIAERSQVQGSWSKRQTVKFFERLVERVMTIASLFDRDPITLTVEEQPITINDPADPTSFISEFMQQPSKVDIDEDSLTYHDVQAEQDAKLVKLSRLLPFAQLGRIDMDWLTTQMVQNCGYKDTKGIVVQPPAPMPGQVPPDAQGQQTQPQPPPLGM